MHHEQCILIICDSAGRERLNFQQLPKLIELKFISTTWLHQLTLTGKVTHQQLSKCSKLFLITLKMLNFT